MPPGPPDPGSRSKSRRISSIVITRRVVVFLLAGAIVNVAVAWGCWLWSPQQWPPTGWSSWDRTGFGWWERHSVREALLDNDGVFIMESEQLAGWPARALSGQATVGLPRTGIGNREMLLLQPIWPGFAINTICYAAILYGGWLLFAAPGFIRRRRIKRGLCPACAYPVGASEGCTECGARVKGSST